MRKFIILLGALMLGVTSSAQTCELYGTVLIHGGYNVLGKQPVVDLAVMGTFDWFRAKVEVGHTCVTDPQIPEALNFTYVSPSIGYSFGSWCDIYVLAGAIPWVNTSEQEGAYVWRKNVWHPKVEVGISFPLGHALFLDIGTMYILPISRTEKNLQNLTVHAGLGVDF